MHCKVMFSALILIVLSGTTHAAPIEFRAAGSLKTAMTEVIEAYQTQGHAQVAPQFAPSGLLRKRIEQGENVDLFASANMKHPSALNQEGESGSVVMFARNKLCALTQPAVSVTPESLLAQMLNNKIRLGTSTPKADPAGDYAFKVFDRAEALSTGAQVTLSNKALQLTGGPTSAKAPDGRNPYGWVMENNQADIFLTYCTNAVLAQKEVSQLKIVQLPDNLSVGANYGLTVIKGAQVDSTELALFILSPQGQTILAKYGFDAPTLP
ncbi:molybdate ABC transporter substrate-binding protein [Shewanella colwelliana]|uniref:molybdate ABC transporter substrate-binding protein n=1 Tax=Shewanella colwelliana TaxID=23 RepID=UPI0022AEF84B|nr:molybdate ABC transporter substrate-binding protein [Shewanella colwelliana]MCZ4336845.1 molybdate ABC transporter substrate-binding protein [Shewanella colwelliana]